MRLYIGLNRFETDLMKAIEAVVPAVLGSPLAVFGHFSSSFHIA